MVRAVAIRKRTQRGLMSRRMFLTGSLLALAMPATAKAQPAGKVPKVGWLSMGTPTSPMAVTSSEAFRQGLRDNGYLEGQNITVEYRYAEGKPERFPEFASEFVRLQVNVIVEALERWQPSAPVRSPLRSPS